MLAFFVLLVIVGIFLMGVEGIIPGFGVFGISGIVCSLLGLFLMADDLKTGLIYVAFFVVCLPFLIPLLVKLLKKSSFSQKLIDSSSLRTREGYTAKNNYHDSFIGLYGQSLSPLRPSGSVLLENGQKIDVVTDGSYIEKEERVKVIKAEGTWFVVEKV